MAPIPRIKTTRFHPATRPLYKPSVTALLSFVLAGGCLDSAEELRRAEDAVVRVEIDGVSACLGTALADTADDSTPRWILTAKHCVVPPGSIGPLPAERVGVWSGDERLGVDRIVVFGSSDTTGVGVGPDLALLRVSDALIGVDARSAGDVAGELDAIAVVRGEGDLLRAQAVGVRRAESEWIYVDGVTCPGDSGGPLLSWEGQLVGVASWRAAGDCENPTGAAVYSRLTADGRRWVRRTLSE